MAASQGFAWTSKTAPPLPEPTGEVVRVSTVSELNSAVSNLKTGTTILIEPGDYALTRTIVLNGPDSVSLRGATGNRDDVILRGKGMREENYGSVPHVISVYNSNDVLIADLTVADAWYHNMHLAGSAGPIRPHIYNVRFLDGGEQLLKANPGYNPTAFPDTGLVEYCRFEYTDRAKHWYTNGVDVLDGANWTLRDCEFVRIRGPEGVLSGSAVLFWHNCYNVVVERNFFYECDFGITLGLGSGVGASKRDPDTRYDNESSIVRNNMIFRRETGDVGISVNKARDYKIYNNTVILNGTFPWTIEYRHSTSTGEIMYNLTDGTIMRRNDANGTLEGNITNADSTWFVDFTNADLHLTEAAGAVIDAAQLLDDVPDDFDGRPRDEDDAPDIGADEFGNEPASGDLDGNGKTDIFDLIGMLQALASGETGPSMDIDSNGRFDILDFICLIRILTAGG